MQPVALFQADAVFGADRAAQRAERGIDQLLDPVARLVRERLRAQHDVQVAIADVAEHHDLGRLAEFGAGFGLKLRGIAFHRGDRQADVECR